MSEPGASPEECVVVPDDDAAEVWNPFDELHDSVEMGSIQKVTAADGMPTSFAPYDASKSDIPPLNAETCVCMGVFDDFVVRNDWGDLLATIDRDKVERSPFGHWRTRVEVVLESLTQGAEDDRYINCLRELGPKAWVMVSPARPPCTHYVRQLSPYDKNPQYAAQFRLCAARRTTEGAFMEIGDRGMYACDMRDPPDSISSARMDAFDREKIKQGKERVHLSMFQGYGEPKEDDGFKGGIFDE